MDIKDIVQRAKEKNAADEARKKEPFYFKTIAWFQYLGLLRSNTIAPQRFTVTLAEVLQAGEIEPRVLELIPAVLLVLPQAVKFTKKDLPEDLANLLGLVRKRQATTDFRGVPPDKYLHWLRAPVMDVAKRRLDLYRMPRRSSSETHAIGAFIRSSRLRLSLTQQQLAKKYHLSLRVIRDLEQGKFDASLKSTNDILKVFGASLNV